jgi:type IV pilus assembly protein PilB
LEKEFNMETILSVLRHEGLIKEGKTWTDITIYQPQGCDRCRDGYRGRAGIYELMEITADLQVLITPTTTSDQLEEAARKSQGFVTMLEDGFIKIVQGVTSLEEVLRVARE